MAIIMLMEIGISDSDSTGYSKRSSNVSAIVIPIFSTTSHSHLSSQPGLVYFQ